MLWQMRLTVKEVVIDQSLGGTWFGWMESMGCRRSLREVNLVNDVVYDGPGGKETH